MRLSRIRIDKYGPLSNIDLVLGAGFQCIYGPNESGKTLLIDALLKTCLGKRERKSMRDLLDRVAEEPKGWILFNDDGRDVTVDGKRTLAQVLDVTADELRDIFVIRNSDLALLDEKRCLGQLTERILNLRTQDIDRVQEGLRDSGRLTDSGGALISAGGKTSPKSQVELAGAIVRDIEEYLESEEASSIGEDERRLISLQIRENVLQNDVTELELAQKWLELREIESAAKISSGFLATQDTLGEDSESRILTTINRYRDIMPNQTRLERELKQFRRLSFLGAAGLLVSTVLAMLLDEGLIGVIQTMSVLAFLMFAGAIWLRRSRALGEIEATGLAVVELAQSYDSNCQAPDDAMVLLNDVIKNARRAFAELEGQLAVLRTRLRTKAQSPQHLLDLAQHKTEELRTKLGQETVREFKEEELEEGKKLLGNVREDLKRLRTRLKGHVDKLADFDVQVASIRFEEYLGQPLGVIADSLDSLAEVKNRLVFFVSEIEKRAQNAKRALAVFSQLRIEEEAKVSKLLSESTRASEVFSDVTRGSYASINYLPKTRRIEVTDKNGVTFAPEFLSRGTKDQLYLSVRVALGEKLLQGKSGFFIMDDPFLTSDLDRSEKQYEVLSDLVRAGWQVILFTAREDLAKSLDERFKTQHIRLDPIRKT